MTADYHKQDPGQEHELVPSDQVVGLMGMVYELSQAPNAPTQQRLLHDLASRALELAGTQLDLPPPLVDPLGYRAQAEEALDSINSPQRRLVAERLLARPNQPLTQESFIEANPEIWKGATKPDKAVTHQIMRLRKAGLPISSQITVVYSVDAAAPGRFLEAAQAQTTAEPEPTPLDPQLVTRLTHAVSSPQQQFLLNDLALHADVRRTRRDVLAQEGATILGGTETSRQHRYPEEMEAITKHKIIGQAITIERRGYKLSSQKASEIADELPDLTPRPVSLEVRQTLLSRAANSPRTAAFLNALFETKGEVVERGALRQHMPGVDFSDQALLRREGMLLKDEAFHRLLEVWPGSKWQPPFIRLRVEAVEEVAQGIREGRFAEPEYHGPTREIHSTSGRTRTKQLSDAVRPAVTQALFSLREHTVHIGDAVHEASEHTVHTLELLRQRGVGVEVRFEELFREIHGSLGKDDIEAFKRWRAAMWAGMKPLLEAKLVRRVKDGEITKGIKLNTNLIGED